VRKHSRTSMMLGAVAVLVLTGSAAASTGHIRAGKAAKEQRLVKRLADVAASHKQTRAPGQLVARASASGAITNVTALGDGTVNATYSATFDGCTSYNFCGWFPEAGQVPAFQSCAAADPGAYLTYVGNYQDASGTQTGTTFFYPHSDPTRICLYAYGPVPGDTLGYTLLTDYVYTAAAPTPITPTAPTPPPTDPGSGDDFDLTAFSIREAKSMVPGLLRKEFHSRFRRGSLTRSCYRYTDVKVRCRVGWTKKPFRYRGNVTVRLDPDDRLNSVLYTVNVHRKRIKAKHHSPAPTKPSPPKRNCDSNYSGCLDPNASDYDCAGGSGDGPRYTGEVRVYGDDHFDLDRDGDGIACDT
jgi:hypothetical protein